jgi:hypothetical protein
VQKWTNWGSRHRFVGKCVLWDHFPETTIADGEFVDVCALGGRADAAPAQPPGPAIQRGRDLSCVSPGGRRSASPPASGVDCPRTFLGHLRHNVEPYRPQELRMVMSEVSLRRIEELVLGVALELRPALAVGDPAVPSIG